MPGSVETYISSHKDAQKYVNEHPDVRPAYDYLEVKWRVWNESNDRLDDGPAEKKLNALFDGLTRHFLHSNATQEDLIRMSSLAARKVSLAEALTIALDQNPDIKDEKSLREKAESAIAIVMPRKDIRYTMNGRTAMQLLKAVQATQNAQEHEKMTASYHLRDHIQQWVRKDVAFEPIAYDKSIAEFGQFRQKRTQEMNRYQNDLIVLETALRPWVQKNGGKTNAMAHALLDAVSERISELEDFRNGLITQLPPQPAALSHCVLHEEKMAGAMPPRLVHKDTGGNSVLSIYELPSLFRDMNDPAHPLINNMENVRKRLSILTANAPHEMYLREFGEVRIKESGIKSWKRAIDKLESFRFDWDQIRDLSRIYIVFNHAPNMFYYSQILRDMAAENHWQMDARSEKRSSHADDGIKVQNSGKMYWGMHMQKKSPHVNNVCEIHLEEAAQQKVEPVTHKIYECVRLFQVDNREIDFSRISDTQYDEFRRFTEQTIDTLLKHRQLIAPEVEKRLTQVSALLRSSAGKEKAHDIYHLLMDAHLVCSASAAKSSLPSMAALYDIKFREMADKEQSTRASKMKLYEEAGPRLSSDTHAHRPGHFQAHHREQCQFLLQEWEKSWGSKPKQRAV